jgi:hypothetical protein
MAHLMTQSSCDREIGVASAAGVKFGVACAKVVSEKILPAARAQEIYLENGHNLIEQYLSDQGKRAFLAGFRLGLLNS